jgi:hypothetical protein
MSTLITTPFGAESTAAEVVGGRYFEDCNEAQTLEPGTEGQAWRSTPSTATAPTASGSSRSS